MLTAWYSKGVVLGILFGKYEEAFACFDKALKINPRNADAWINKGNALDQLGKYKEAMICFEKASGFKQ